MTPYIALEIANFIIQVPLYHYSLSFKCSPAPLNPDGLSL